MEVWQRISNQKGRRPFRETAGAERFVELLRQRDGHVEQLHHFLSDVRAEMRKVVTPTRKEVQATTSVVIVTVFLFGLFFWVVDSIFSRALQAVLHKLGAQ